MAFSSFDAHKVHNLRQLAGNSVAAGMSRPDAVKALSSVPAQAFGQAQSYGGLMVGKVANLVVWTGDPFEMSSWAKNLVVRGRSFLPESRQDALYERYRDLKRIPVGDGRAVSGS